MGLIGRLEDLPVSDIIQIVYLSRRTGVLEIKKRNNIFRIYFIKGGLVFAEKNVHLGIDELLLSTNKEIDPAFIQQAQAVHAAMPERSMGDILLEMNVCSPADLAKTIYAQIQELAYEILQDEEGEFSFDLRDRLTSTDIGYSPDKLFKQSGIPPDKILTRSGEIGIIKEIRDTLVRGKEAFKAGAQVAPVTMTEHPEEEGPAVETVPAPEPPVEIEAAVEELPPRQPAHTILVERETALIPTDIDIHFRPKDESPKLFGKFSLLSKEGEQVTDLGYNLCILEGDPLLRVTLKRIFSKGGFKVYHYNQTQTYLSKVRELLEAGEPSVLVLGISNTLQAREIESALRDIQGMQDSQPPTVVIHPGLDPRQHHTSYLSGADLVMVRPDLTTMSVKASEEVLNTFVEDVLIAVQRYIQRLPEFTERQKFHDIAAKERLNRSLTLLKNLIFELANPEDKTQVGLMTLRMAAEYLERAVILLVKDEHFVGIGGFGLTGDDVPMNLRVRNTVIPEKEESIFSQVSSTLKPHRGKLRRTKWNEYFLNQLGKIFPNEVVLIPVVARGKLIGVLYGDNAEFKRPIGNTDGLEIFLSQAGYAFEDVIHSIRWKGVS